jgi:hypothetical protein
MTILYDRRGLLTQNRRSSEAKELHVIRTPDGNSVTNVLCVDALDIGSVDCPGVAALGVVRLCALGLAVVVAEDTSPLLHGLLVVLGAQGSIRAAVVDLHLGAASSVAGVHIGNNLGPCCGSRSGCALSAGAVPGIDTTGA